MTGLTENSFPDASTVYPGYYYLTLYGVVTVNGTSNVTFTVTTTNWHPPEAADYMMIYSFRNVSSTEVTDLNGSSLEVINSAVMELLFTLYVPYDTPSNMTSVSFDIIVEARAQ